MVAQSISLCLFEEKLEEKGGGGQLLVNYQERAEAFRETLQAPGGLGQPCPSSFVTWNFYLHWCFTLLFVLCHCNLIYILNNHYSQIHWREL